MPTIAPTNAPQGSVPQCLSIQTPHKTQATIVRAKAEPAKMCRQTLRSFGDVDGGRPILSIKSERRRMIPHGFSKGQGIVRSGIMVGL